MIPSKTSNIRKNKNIPLDLLAAIACLGNLMLVIDTNKLVLKKKVSINKIMYNHMIKSPPVLNVCFPRNVDDLPH
jgi:hypothetical protein